MKFVHAADLHIDSPLRGLEEYEGCPVERVRHSTRDALENLVRLCCEQDAKFLILAGDLFDYDWRDFNTALFVVRQFQTLAKAGIPVYLIAGNHDSRADMSRNVPWPSNVTVFDHKCPQTLTLPALDTALHGMSFPKREVTENLVPAYPSPIQGMLNVGVLHTNANGCREHESYAPCTVPELANKGYDYWALGHVHSFGVLHEQPYVVYSGNTQGRHIRESGRKGCAVVTVDGGEVGGVEFFPTDVLRWFDVRVTLEPEDGLDELYDRTRQQLRRVGQEADNLLAAVRLHVEGRCTAHGKLALDATRQEAVAELRALAGEQDDLWIEKIRFQTRPPLDLSSLRQGQDLIGDLLRDVESLRQDGPRLESMLAELEPLAAKAGAELAHEGIDLKHPELLAAWLQEAQDLLLGHLVEERP